VRRSHDTRAQATERPVIWVSSTLSAPCHDGGAIDHLTGDPPIPVNQGAIAHPPGMPRRRNAHTAGDQT
jgi:hypothetical protein